MILGGVPSSIKRQSSCVNRPSHWRYTQPEFIRIRFASPHENFEDSKTLFLSPLLAFTRAWDARERGIGTAADARSIRDALDGISVDAIKCKPYDGTCEDLFFYVERLLVRACGEDVAGRLHTARSRNDIDMTMYRMRHASSWWR